MKHIIRQLICGLLALCLCLTLTGCGTAKDDTATAMGFSDAVSIERIRALDGKRVTINGYMATLSPISGKYLYLMNMPYQSCPFCVPNTQTLANTIAVYAPEGGSFEFTDRAVAVTGTLQVGDYTDEFGYTYNYRIINASVSVVDLSNVSGSYALWQTIAEDGIVSDINTMLDYLYFVCCWPEYTMTYTDGNGNTQTVNLYPGDVENYLADTGPYGYASFREDGYFPGLAAHARALGGPELEELAGIVESAKEVETLALAELSAGRYTYDELTDAYTLDNADMLYGQWQTVWFAFSEWLGKWQM